MNKTLAIVAILCVVAVSVSASIDDKAASGLFRAFVKQHNKRYTVDEFQFRFQNFKANLNLIAKHNAEGKSYKLAVNQFADMTQEEFRSKFLGFNFVDRSYYRSLNTASVNVTAPASIDWVTKGAVTPVKNQGQCGSCWSFSTTGSVEGAWAIAKGQLVSLSEQQLVDCSGSFGNQGCNGGLMDQAFQYIISNKGLCTEASYAYTGADGTCQSCTPVATISSFTDVTSGDENALVNAVAVGPVSVAIEADQSVFQYYSSGVLDDASCGTTLDHGVLVVGYGTDSASGKNFFKIKNSWGPSWGANGYVLVVRTGATSISPNNCGVSSQPSYPVV